MNKKLLTILCLGMFLISFASALDSLGTFKKAEQVRITQVCSDATYINISSISYPNSSTAVLNIEMTSSGSGEYYYNFTSTEVLGRYDVRGVSDGCEKTFATYFDVTYNGQTISGSKVGLYLGFLTILCLILFLNFFGMGFLPKRNTRDEEGKIMSISYLKYLRDILWMSGYFLFIAILFIASNLAFAFLQEELVAQTLFLIYRITFGIAPLVVIVWFIWIIASMFHDKQFQQMLNRGIFPQGTI